MDVIVFIKQIPENDQVKLDSKTGNLIRDGVESIINPVDKNAIEAALSLKDQFGGKVTAVTMGPPAATDVLKRALFMGCDDAVLLSDKAFGGADTLATGYTLATAAKKIGNYDLLVLGNRAADAETAQTGPVTAGILNLPLITSVTNIFAENGFIYCTREFSNGTERSRAALPAVITVKPEINTPRFQTPRNVITGLKKGITVWNSNDLCCASDRIGVTGSPSRTKRVVAPPTNSECGQVIKGSTDEMATALISILSDEHLV